MDKKVEKFFNNLINKLKKPELDIVFDYCFNLLFADSPKISAHHGYIMFIQLMLKQTPNLLANNIEKVIKSLTNSHKFFNIILLISVMNYSIQTDIAIKEY